MKPLQEVFKKERSVPFVFLLLILYLVTDLFWFWGVLEDWRQTFLILLGGILSTLVFLGLLYQLQGKKQKWANLLLFWIGLFEIGITLGFFHWQFQLLGFLKQQFYTPNVSIIMGLNEQSYLFWSTFGGLYLLQGLKIALWFEKVKKGLAEVLFQKENATTKKSLLDGMVIFSLLVLFSFIFLKKPFITFHAWDTYITNEYLFYFVLFLYLSLHFVIAIAILHKATKIRFVILAVLSVCDLSMLFQHINFWYYVSHFREFELFPFLPPPEAIIDFAPSARIDDYGLEKDQLRSAYSLLNLALFTGVFVSVLDFGLFAFFRDLSLNKDVYKA